MIELLAQTSTTATICVVVTASAIVLHSYLRYQARKYPPGPLGDPFIGNVRHMPEKHPWLYYTELKKKYGSPLVRCWYTELLLTSHFFHGTQVILYSFKSWLRRSSSLGATTSRINCSPSVASTTQIGRTSPCPPKRECLSCTIF